MPINIRIPNARPPFRATALLLFLLSCLPLHSQVLTTLDTFTLNASGGVDVPRSLIQGSDGNLYATTISEPSGALELLKITRDGSISMVAVTPVTDCRAIIQGSDGNFYGYSLKSQTLCQITPAGTSSAILSFSQALVANNIDTTDAVISPLIQANDGFLYGTAYGTSLNGGAIGIVWKMSLSGEFALVCTFPSPEDEPQPYSILLQGKDGNFYGTTTETSTDGGTIFKVTPSGALTTLHTFNGSDGSFPDYLVSASDGALYGITSSGGASNAGTFFKIDSSGTFSALYNFGLAPASSLYGPVLVQASDGNFYGLQATGGTNGDGTIYKLTSGGVFSVVYDFGSTNTTPKTLINGSNGTIYGITANPELSQVLGTIFQFVPGSSSGSLPSISSGGVISAGAFGAFTSAAPGSWIEIYGSNLATDTRGWTGADFNGINAPTSLDGTSVTVGGQSAFVDFISPGQVNALIPSDVPTGVQPIVVTAGTVASAPVDITINAVQPGLLAPPSFKVNGVQYAVALFGDGTYVLPTGAVSGLTSRPAKPGDEIVLYGVGFGPVIPDIPAGELVQQSNALQSSFNISIGGVAAQPVYDGLAPSYTGLYQFNVTVPAAAPGNAALTFVLGGVSGTQTLYLALGQ
jgi:uncharacterized protein (TIGR03437 family)